MDFFGFNKANSVSLNSVKNVVKNNAKNMMNRSDDMMVMILIGILVVVIIYFGYKYYKYRKEECPAGVSKVPFYLYSVSSQVCEMPAESAEAAGLVPSSAYGDRVAPRDMELIPGTASMVMMDKPITPENVNDEVPLPSGKQEVFHISNQDYTYEQARCKCASYGARLATYEDIVDAYNNGADWCSYGWTEGQRAYYPTQKCTWDKLQTGDKTLRNSCGLPGVNGGFFPSPDMKFGATCFGAKPEGKVVKPKIATCTTGVCERPGNEDAAMRKKTDMITPFNADQWNQ